MVSQHDDATLTGRRSVRVRAEAPSATVDAILKEGLEGVSVADVAVRAGVHETSICRRWDTKDALVVNPPSRGRRR